MMIATATANPLGKLLVVDCRSDSFAPGAFHRLPLFTIYAMVINSKGTTLETPPPTIFETCP